jgi:hypothetical protein
MAAEGTGVPAGGGGEEPLAAANEDGSEEQSAPTDAIASSSAAGDLSPSPASACLRVWDSTPPAVIGCLSPAPCGVRAAEFPLARTGNRLGRFLLRSGGGGISSWEGHLILDLLPYPSSARELDQ